MKKLGNKSEKNSNEQKFSDVYIDSNGKLKQKTPLGDFGIRGAITHPFNKNEIAFVIEF